MKYLIVLILLLSQSAAGQTCSGVPVAGTASASTLAYCGNSVHDTLNLTGYTADTGIYFQWLSSPDTITWTAIPGATNTTFAFTDSASAYYTARAVCSTSGDTAYSNYLPITINAAPSSISGEIFLCGNFPGGSTTLTDSLSGGVWSSADTNYAIVDAVTGVVTLGSGAGPYFDTAFAPLSVAIMYTLLTGCSATALVPIYFCEAVPSVAGINDKIVIAPNPALNELVISASEKMTSIVITDMLGQTVYHQKNNGNELRLDVSTFTVGVYFVNINGKYIKKFVKI